jgi:hypothetical protein
MKTNLLFKLVVVLIFNVALLKAQVPTPDILHYKFGPSGTTVANVASSPPVGTATGTLLGTQTQTGAINCMGALVGSGVTSTSDYVNTGWATNLPASWSISFWTSNIQPNSTLYYIFGDNNAGGFRCFTNGVAGANNWILRGGFTDILITGAATPSANMVTFVYDQSVNATFGYINGVQTVSVAQTATPTISGAGPFKVGGYASNTGLSPSGLMADFRVYGSALTATQVAAIYAATSTSFVTVSVSGSTAVCSGQSSVLTASGTASTYSWNTSATTASISVTPTATSTYSVIGAAGTCTAQSVYTVNVNALPNVTVNSSTVCFGQASATLIASGANTYSWSNTATTASISVSPLTNTTYTVTGTGTNSCVQSTTASVVVNASPIVSVTNATICSGQNATLTASGAATYSWSNAAATASISVAPTTNTTYVVTGTGTNSCAKTVTANVSVNASPSISVVSSASLICVGQSASLTPSGASTYTITGGSLVISPTVTTSYTVNGTAANGCQGSNTITQNVSPCTGINNLASTIQNVSFLVYPNPTNDILNIKLDLTNESNTSIQLVNALGQVIISKNASQEISSLNVSSLTSGIYFVKLIQNGKVLDVKKVVKQ